MFQSRNGLIWTIRRQMCKMLLICCFNPATVWFEPVGDVRNSDVEDVSIPQRSDLNFKLIGVLTKLLIVSIPQRSDLNPFTFVGFDLLDFVSIPQRSDLNHVGGIDM